MTIKTHVIGVPVPAELFEAVTRAAEARWQTNAEFARQALLRDLERQGALPARREQVAA